jgi:hypothetical protein
VQQPPVVRELGVEFVAQPATVAQLVERDGLKIVDEFRFESDVDAPALPIQS